MEELDLLHKKNGEILDSNEWNKLVSIINYIIEFYNHYPTKLSEFENDIVGQFIGPKGDKGDKGDTGNTGPQGPKGEDGTVAFESLTEEQVASLKGPQGEQGIQGLTGQDGKSAYDIYVETTSDNPVKTQAEWLESLVGSVGKSAYELYLTTVEQGETPLSLQEWLNSLKGQSGSEGKSAYQSYVDTTSDNPIKTEEEWIASLHGQDGAAGQNGQDGQNGITPYIDQTTGNWMIGETDTGIHAQGPSGNDGQNGSNGSNGTNGQDGKSAYELAVDNGYNGTVQQWLDSLKGQDGSNGINGSDGSNGITPHIDSTTKHWMIGSTDTGIVAEGQDGSNGTNGTNGTNGVDGITPHIDSTTGNWFIGSTDTGVQAQGPAGQNGTNGTNGVTPHIDSTTKHWMIGDTDTGVVAEGQDGSNGTNGSDGITPHIDSTTGNWFIGSTDTGVHAQGPAGQDGVVTGSQAQADWNQTDNTSVDYIKNKPTIPTVPTNVSAFTNDAGYLTSHQDISGKANSADLATVATSGSYDDLSNKPSIPAKISNLQDDSNFLQIPDNQNVFVDMGLPSGILWATCDIDVTKPNGFCETPFTYEKFFFSWGNIDGHNPISTSAFDYNWGGVNQADPWYEGQPYGSTKGNTLTGNIAVGEDFDAARANLGAPWRMPTNGEYGELFANIIYINADGTEVDTTKTDKRVTVNGIVGLYIQSKINGARLFFSCSGYGNGSSWDHRGSRGYYWSSTFDSSRYARRLGFGSGGADPASYSNRYIGFAVRAVLNPSSLKASTVALTGSYNDLTNKPIIPTVPTNVSSFTNDVGYLTSHQSLTDYVQKSQTAGLLKNDGTVDTNTYLTTHQDISGKANSADLATVATSGSYNDLSNRPTIPSKVSDLNNDINLIKTYVNNTHDYVEIGGTKWATMNVGATTVTDTGLYFAWGENIGYTIQQKRFTVHDYKYSYSDSNNPNTIIYTKYNNTDNSIELCPEDDGASHYWGNGWRMPTKKDFEELFHNTTRIWTSDYNNSGVAGVIFTDKTDNSKILFFPAAGEIFNSTNQSLNSRCYYWIRSINYFNGQYNYYRADYLYCENGFINDPYNDQGSDKCSGSSIRAVLSNPIASTVATTGSYNDLIDKPTIPIIWSGTQAQYDAITTPDANTIYIITASS